MHIAVYLAHYPHPPGGTTASVHGLTQGLARAGCEVTILAQAGENRRYREGEVEVTAFRRVSRLPFVVPSELLSIIEGAPFDLLVLGGIFHRDLPPLARAARRAQQRYVHLPLGWYSDAMFQRHGIRKRMYWRLFERKLIEGAEAVHAFSAAEAQHLRARGVQAPILVLPQGSDVMADTDLRFSTDGPIEAGFLGRIDTFTKGLDLYLRAVALAREEVPELRVVIQGPDSGSRPGLERLAAKLKLEDAVAFRDPEYGRSLALMSQWDIVVLPSRHDSFPFVVVEAMHAGRVVLCSSETGTAEHVQRSGCGIAVRPDVDSIAAALREAVRRRSQWPEMGQAGQAYARKHLTWDAEGQRVAREYARLLG